MKNRRNIIESELPPQNHLDIWMKDGKFYRSTNKGWVLIEDQMEFTNSELMSKSTATSGTIGVNKETGKASIYNDVTKQWSPLNGGGVTETTWQQLKDKRDNGQLIPGSLYRITDYQCTTTQANTESAGHQFDIVLLALSEDKLAEEGWAMEHPTDVYDVTFNDGVIKKCYLYIIDGDYNIIDCETLLGTVVGNNEIVIDESNKTADVSGYGYNSTDLIEENLIYNYFQNSNLSAWKVWYCLDNDKSRFAWADDSVDEDSPAFITAIIRGKMLTLYRYSTGDLNNLFAWKGEDRPFPDYTASQTPSVGDTIYNEAGTDTGITVNSFTPAHQGTGLPNGRGVIYRMIDEFNNDIKYDFKNIQFKRTITGGSYDENGTETWCYTFNIWYNDMCQDASIVGNTLLNDEGFVNGVYNNIFGYATAYDLYIEGVESFAFALGDNVVLSFIDGGYYGIYSNTIGNSFYSNTIGNSFVRNTILIDFNRNIIGNDFYANKIENSFYANKIGNLFYFNSIENGFSLNTIGSNVYSNTFGNDFNGKTISDNTNGKNYGNSGVELATKDDIGDIETALNNI